MKNEGAKNPRFRYHNPVFEKDFESRNLAFISQTKPIISSKNQMARLELAKNTEMSHKGSETKIDLSKMMEEPKCGERSDLLTIQNIQELTSGGSIMTWTAFGTCIAASGMGSLLMTYLLMVGILSHTLPTQQWISLTEDKIR